MGSGVLFFFAVPHALPPRLVVELRLRLRLRRLQLQERAGLVLLLLLQLQLRGGRLSGSTSHVLLQFGSLVLLLGNGVCQLLGLLLLDGLECRLGFLEFALVLGAEIARALQILSSLGLLSFKNVSFDLRGREFLAVLVVQRVVVVLVMMMVLMVVRDVFVQVGENALELRNQHLDARTRGIKQTIGLQRTSSFVWSGAALQLPCSKCHRFEALMHRDTLAPV